jgi:hypothetical protein
MLHLNFPDSLVNGVGNSLGFSVPFTIRQQDLNPRIVVFIQLVRDDPQDLGFWLKFSDELAHLIQQLS